MDIRAVFATTITERIEPVVKVLDRKPAVVSGELTSLVITPQWERFLHQALDAYTDAADRADEGGIGIWISGFFGPGKSLLMKVLGVLLAGGEIGGRPVHDIFLDRLPPDSRDRADLQRFLAVCERKLVTAAVGGNLHAEQASGDDPLALIAFKLFARAADFTHSWPLAWAVEYHIDAQGLTTDFRRRAEELAGQPWEDIAADTAFHSTSLYQAAADAMPAHFHDIACVERAINAALTEGGVTPTMLVDRLRGWCAARDNGARRQKLLLQLDELGQWIRSGNSNERIMQVQALAEAAATRGAGRVWLAATAHGDVQSLGQNVEQEQYAKINQRFALRCKLSNDDIGQVVEERLLRKTQPGRKLLSDRFAGRAGELADLGSVANAQRVYAAPTADSFALFYPYMPWTIAAVPDVVRGIAQAAQRGDELTGSTRTLIGVTQGAIIETSGLLDAPVGRLLCLADLYEQVQSDVPIETKTDLSRIRANVPDATAHTERVARALFLLGQIVYIPATLDNVTRALVDSIDVALPQARARAREELDRLVRAGYAKQVGDAYTFLSTQQRGFQDNVRDLQARLRDQTYDLSQALKAYDSDETLRIDRVPLAGREITLKLTIDGRAARNPNAPVALHLYTPLQRALDPGIGEDEVMRQRSNADPNNLYLRMDDVKGLREALALALATEQEADRAINNPQGGPEREVARLVKAQDLPNYKADVSRLLAQALRGGVIFFRGTRFALAPADSTAAAVRATLAQQPLLPTVYSRFGELPQRLVNDETAVKAALAGTGGNADLQALGAYRADGTLNDASPLLSTLRGRLPLAEQDAGLIAADDLRGELERPPFGWDGNAVKVGLALLLRASACRLVENGRYLTDPTSPDAVRLLTKEQSFKNLRVQGVKSDLDTATLRDIRAEFEALFVRKPALVAATLHNELGTELAALAARALAVADWAAAAQCPLPAAFDAGRGLAEELAGASAVVGRLRIFHERHQDLGGYVALLDALEAFRREHGAAFGTLRDFFNRMVNANLEVPALRAFVEDWRTLVPDGAVTVAARWRELHESYRAAQQALTEQAALWRRQTEEGLADDEARLAEQVREVGAPDEAQEAALSTLRACFSIVRQRLAAPAADAVSARDALTALQAVRLELPGALRTLRERYRPPTSGAELRISWRELLGTDCIAHEEDLRAALTSLEQQGRRALEQQKTVVIE